MENRGQDCVEINNFATRAVKRPSLMAVNRKLHCDPHGC